jgi:anti-sigma regulatory factor (Ser/Thr protein kinase)
MRMRMRSRYERDQDRRNGCGERTAWEPFAPSSGAAAEVDFTIDELGALRRLVSEATERTSLGAERASDLVMAVNELAINSICHGGGHGTLRLWRDRGALMCEVRDDGHIRDVDVRLGAGAPSPDALSGRGLWLVDQLCDDVQISSSPHTGSAVRVQMQLP